MEARILRQDKLLELVDALIENHEAIAPQDELSYGQISGADEIAFGDEKPARSLSVRSASANIAQSSPVKSQ